MPYTDDLDPEEQIDAEEYIGGYIYSLCHPDVAPDIDEEKAMMFGKTILHEILRRFRPDLLTTTTEER